MPRHNPVTSAVSISFFTILSIVLMAICRPSGWLITRLCARAINPIEDTRKENKVFFIIRIIVYIL